MAFSEIEPFGARRDELRAGVIAATVANSQRGKETPPFRPADFFAALDDDAPNPEASADNSEFTPQHAMAMTLALGGQIIRRPA